MQRAVLGAVMSAGAMGCIGIDRGLLPPSVLRAVATRSTPTLPLMDRHAWQARTSHFPTGAGPNTWSTDGVAWSPDGVLLKLVPRAGGGWHAAEVRTPWPDGYGTLELIVEGPLGRLPAAVVFGAFLYRDDTNELDFELSRWGEPTPLNAQFVVAPAIGPRRHRFTIPERTRALRLRIDWRADVIRYALSTDGGVSYDWTYLGPGLPTPRACFVHLNLWLLAGHSFAGPAPQLRIRQLHITQQQGPSP